jgi:hypothetical protein
LRGLPGGAEGIRTAMLLRCVREFLAMLKAEAIRAAIGRN